MVDLAWPAIVGMSFYALNTFVDVIFIGQLVGEQAVAGVSLAFPLASIPMGVAAMLGSGGGSLLSIAIGAGDSALHKRLSGLTGSLAIIATLPMAAAGAFFSELFLQWMGGSGEPLRLGAQYFSVLSLFFPVTVYAISANMLVRAEGRMRTAMKILAVSTVVNVALNPLFIRTFGLGIRGSALATNVAMVALAAAGAVYFRSGKSSAREPVSLFAYDPKIFKRIISIGLSSFIFQGMGVCSRSLFSV
jgi:Na+-driven multidrug efflux pump